MIALLDTHLLIWAAYQPEKLPTKVREFLLSETDVPMFSAASIWEISIKSQLQKTEFNIDPNILRRGLLEGDYLELTITAKHAAETATLPFRHKDPFDRMLIAQARSEGVPFFTVDSKLAEYGSPVTLFAK